MSGASATLSWEVEGADTVEIDNGIGTVTPKGTRQVTPAWTTSFNLVARSGSSPATATVQVRVVPGASPSPSPSSVSVALSESVSLGVAVSQPVPDTDSIADPDSVSDADSDSDPDPHSRSQPDTHARDLRRPGDVGRQLQRDHRPSRRRWRAASASRSTR